jgi:hypothetical protein
MQIVELGHVCESRLQHLREGERVDRLEFLRTDTRDELMESSSNISVCAVGSEVASVEVHADRVDRHPGRSRRNTGRQRSTISTPACTSGDSDLKIAKLERIPGTRTCDATV